MDAATRKRMSSSARHDWCTPPEVVACLTAFGTVELDPCSHRASIVGAAVELFKPDGLGPRSWLEHAPQLRRPRHFAYVNHEYGRVHGPLWVARCVEQAATGVEIVELVAARVDAAWFRLARDHAAALAIVRGRLRFIKPRRKRREPAFFPSAFLYYGNRPAEFEAVFSAIADPYRYVRHHRITQEENDHHAQGRDTERSASERAAGSGRARARGATHVRLAR